MTFDLSAEQQAARDRARAFARDRVQPGAPDVDRQRTVPPDLARDAAALVAGAGDAVARTVAIEALAAASGAVALAAGGSHGRRGATALELSGLRGAPAVDDSPAGHLLVAAVALGLGQAALTFTLEQLRAAAARPGRGGDQPHWVMADAATELEAARLLTYRAAALGGRGATDTALARLQAAAAAAVAVDAAIRIGGAAAFTDGSLLERLSRDVRAVSLLPGTEEQARAVAADGLLPG